MPVRFVGLLALLAACANGPAAPFDAGQDVHVILKLTERPKVALGLRPVVTVGTVVEKCERRAVGPKGALAVEMAILSVPRGRHRLSVWEPTTRTDAREDLDVTGDVWVVLEIAPGAGKGRLRVYDRPPHAEIGPWVPLIAVPD